MFSDTEEEDREAKETISSKTEKKNTKKKVKSIVKTKKTIILDAKWTNYSQQFLGQTFSIPKDINLVQLVCDSEATVRQIDCQLDSSFHDLREMNIDLTQMNDLLPLPNIATFHLSSPFDKYSPSPTPSCSSPRDVNEISLSISLLQEGEENRHHKLPIGWDL